MISGKVKKWLPALLEAARSHKGVGRASHAAALIKGKRCIIAINDGRCPHWLKKYGYWSLHAEAAVMHNIPNEVINGSTLIVIRVTRDGKLAESRPCNKCSKLLLEKRIKRTYYSTTNGSIERMDI